MTLDRRGLMAAGLVAALPAVARAQNVGVTAADVKLDELLKTTGAPALAGLIVTRDGRQSIVAGGVRRAGGTEAVTSGDLWHIGSNTKAMTAALYGRYVDRGRARWGARLPALFPDLKLDAAWAETTIDDLLGHRAGISDPPVMRGGWLGRAHGDKRPMTTQRTELAAQVLGAAPAGKPGTFEYSNIGYILAGAAIERITRTSWEDAITADLFVPLGMKSAGFGAPLGANPWGHIGNTPGKLMPVDPAGLSDNPAALGPAGRVRLTLSDHAKFARLFLTNGGGYLRPETVTRLTTAQPASTYAIGWGVGERPWSGGPMIAHEGSNTMWHATIMVLPAKGVAFLTACNAGAEGSVRAANTLAQRLKDFALA